MKSIIILALLMTGCSSMITRGELNQCRTSCGSLGMETAFDSNGNCSCKVSEELTQHEGPIEIKEEEVSLELPAISKDEVIQDLQSQIEALKAENVELKKSPEEKESDKLLNEVRGMFVDESSCLMEKDKDKSSEKIISEDLYLEPVIKDEIAPRPIED